jgi:hypothetical protein
MGTKPLDRITVEAGKMNGQPCIRGMRLTVKRARLGSVLKSCIISNPPARVLPEATQSDVPNILDFEIVGPKQPSHRARQILVKETACAYLTARTCSSPRACAA